MIYENLGASEEIITKRCSASLYHATTQGSNTLRCVVLRPSHVRNETHKSTLPTLESLYITWTVKLWAYASAERENTINLLLLKYTVESQ
jgi:hypothetical protein